MNDKKEMTVKTNNINFRYSHWYEYWAIFVGGGILLTIVLFVLFRITLDSIGINQIHISLFWEQHILLGLGIIVGSSVFIIVFSWLFSRWVAKKMSDRQGIALFNEKTVDIRLKNKILTYNYADFKKIEYVEYIYFERYKGILVPPKADLIFYSNTGKYKISVSVQESWQWFKKLPLLERVGFRGKSVFLPIWIKYDDFYNCSEITFVEFKNEFKKYVNVETVVKH